VINRLVRTMTEITLKLNLSKEILEKIDISKIKKKLEREIMIEYSLIKLHGSLKEKELTKLLREVEEEWGYKSLHRLKHHFEPPKRSKELHTTLNLEIKTISFLLFSRNLMEKTKY